MHKFKNNLIFLFKMSEYAYPQERKKKRFKSYRKGGALRSQKKKR